MKTCWRWLVTDWNWPGAAAFCGAVLLLLVPVVFLTAGWAISLVLLQLPLYMFHQLEEHAGDRFRRQVNEVIGGGLEVLSRPATFVINSLGVWGIDLLAIYLAVFVAPGWGLMAIYLPLVNALGHIGEGLVLRRYNPGLWTALLLFVPVSGTALFLLSRGAAASHLMQAAGFAVALLVHVAIIAHVKFRKRALIAPGPARPAH